MKTLYFEPMVEVVRLMQKDVICTSPDLCTNPGSNTTEDVPIIP